MIVVGDPEQCMKKIRRYEELGVDQLICYVQFGTLPHESIMRTIQLLGEHVIPELEKNPKPATISVPAGTSS
jgi:alkanesulfonate monooxygenase SsuD/methylene tetrahydromethanopterin reductase-like flavin-dependent oxidoreductase (luciferase family)